MPEIENPYKYQGPLDPTHKEDALVCSPRENEVNSVIQGLRRGDYWTILGPRQIGKTTLLFLIEKEFKHAHYIYIDFEVAPESGKKFYQWLIDEIQEKIPHKKKYKGINEDDDPPMIFFDFLKNFKPKDEDKKIILLFDEIDRLPSLKSFLHLWRKIFHERVHTESFKRYGLITTGARDLIKLTVGPNSPFNIAKILYLEDFADNESEKLIIEPFKRLNIKIEEKAKEKLLSQISGHPQLLQHACYILVKNTKSPNYTAAEKDVNVAIERLLAENTILKTLAEDINTNPALTDLLKNLLKGKRKKYYPYKDLAILGAGAIKEEKSLCKIRNPIYERFILDILSNLLNNVKPPLNKKEKPEEKVEARILPGSTQPKPDSPNKKLVKILFWIFFILTFILFIISVITNNSVLMAGAGILIMPTLVFLSILLKGNKDEH